MLTQHGTETALHG